MERVSQDTAVRHWLREELSHPRADPKEVSALDDRVALDRLLQLKPGAAAFIWRDAPVVWYRLDLTRREFLDLHVVPGPEGLGWAAMSPDGTIRGAAERLDRPDAGEAGAEGIDIERIRELRAGMPVSAPTALMLSTRHGCVPWRVVDGNHRAVALARYLIDGGDYEPQPAYLGIGTNPVARPLRERLCGGVKRLLGRTARPARQR